MNTHTQRFCKHFCNTWNALRFFCMVCALLVNADRFQNLWHNIHKSWDFRRHNIMDFFFGLPLRFETIDRAKQQPFSEHAFVATEIYWKTVLFFSFDTRFSSVSERASFWFRLSIAVHCVVCFCVCLGSLCNVLSLHFSLCVGYAFG